MSSSASLVVPLLLCRNRDESRCCRILLESLGYGMFFVLFVCNTYLQKHNHLDRRAKYPNVLLLVASTLLFVMITARWAIGVSRIYEAVVVLEGRIPLSSYFADITLKKQLAVSALIEVQIIVADFILVHVYRLYHVWKPNWWLCIIPVLAWIGACISTGVTIWNMSHAEPIGVSQRDVARWATASFSCTIANNVYCTTAIIVRLWRCHSAVAHATLDSRLWRVLRVFVESASLFTVFVIVTFVLFLAGYNIEYAILDAGSPVIGISFVLIQLRLNFDKHETNNISKGSTGKRGISSNYPLQPISVDVSRHVDGDSDLEIKNVDNGSYGDMA